MADVRPRYTHARYVWLDQARGVVGLLFVISFITWEYRGDIMAGDEVIAPPHLDHGYNYFQSAPPILTLIDAGQPIFMFFVGISAYIAYAGRLRRHSRWSAWRYVMVRLTLIYLISAAGEIRRTPPSESQLGWATYFAALDWYKIFLSGILATVAAGALATYLAVAWIPSVRQRMWIAIAVWVTYSFVYAMHLVDRDTYMDFMLDLPRIPMMTVSLAALSVFGSCFGQWILEGSHDMNASMKRFIVPASLWCLTACYCLSWVQPGDHHEATPTLMLMAAGLSGLLIASHYGLYEIGVTAPILNALGKNLLFVFLVTAIGCPLYLSQLPDWLVYEYPVCRMILAGVLPLAAVVLLALLLDKKNLVLRL